MKEQIQQVAARIKELREIFDFDIAKLAEHLGVPQEVYKQYETDGTNVPISVLYKLAGLYNVDMTEILTGKSPRLNSICLVRKGEGIEIDRFKGYKYENIGYKFMHRKMEPMIVTLEPTHERPKLVTHNGQEINYCLEGEMIVYFNDKQLLLAEGDCVYFDPSHPHGQQAAGVTARFLTIIHE